MTSLPACMIVGAGPGLGSAIARRFAAAGHPVGVLGRSTDPLDHLVAELTATGATAVAAVADAADPDDLRAGLSRLSEHLSPVGALVYNAASYTDGALTGLPPERLQADYAVNVTGALTAVQHALPSLRQQHGTALLTGGGAALYPSGQYASLSLTKSGLRLLAQLLHDELTPQGVHLTTVTIEGSIGSRPHFAPDTIAETYLRLHQQPPEQWSFEYQYAD